MSRLARNRGKEDRATGRRGGAALALACLLAACANDQQRTRTEGVATGAVVGGVIGHIIGGRDGAALGAVLGGAAGGLAGNQVAEKKRLYAQREDALKTAAAQSQAVTQQARSANEAAQRTIALLEASVARLQTESLTASSRNELARSSRRSFEDANGRLDQLVAAVRGELSRQREVMRREQDLAKQTNEASPPAELRLVSAGVRDLESTARALEHAKAQLALLDARRAF